MRGKFKLLGVLLAMIFFAISSSASAETDWNTNTIRATGFGVPNPRFANNPTQAMGMARTAAIADARRNLLAEIKGVQVDSETTVENMMTTSDVIKTKVSGLLIGARVVDEGPVAGGGYSVTMEIPMFGNNNSLAENVIERPQNIEPFRTPPTEYRPPVSYNPPPIPEYNPPTYSAGGNYTGLIIDCRNAGEINPVMSPVVKDENGDGVYGHTYVDPDKIVRDGMVSYARTKTEASRAGSNPLIVRAIGLRDHNANPILSMEDAKLVLYENNISHFLDKTAVVFLR